MRGGLNSGRQPSLEKLIQIWQRELVTNTLGQVRGDRQGPEVRKQRLHFADQLGELGRRRRQTFGDELGHGSKIDARLSELKACARFSPRNSLCVEYPAHPRLKHVPLTMLPVVATGIITGVGEK